MTGSLSRLPSWARVALVAAAYTWLWIAWRAGMEVLHPGFTYLVILLATVVCGALIQHWSVVLLGAVPVLVFLGQGAPDGVSAPSELLDFFTPVVASCALIGSEIARRLGRMSSANAARDLERPLKG
jgi:hypothetical protein